MQNKILVLMRHSKALDMYESGVKDDFSRPLSHEGVIKAQEQAKKLKEELGSVDIIAASPLLRAKQTAEIVANAFGIKQINLIPELADSMAINAYGEIVKELTSKYNRTIIIGHNPAISALARERSGEYVSMSAGDYKITEF